MAVFLTQEWLDLFREEVNRSPGYAAAARTWEGSFVFVSVDEDPAREAALFVDLWHGKCRSAHVVPNPKLAKGDYMYKLRYRDWVMLLQGKLHPVKDILTGKIRIEGNVTQLLSHRRAAEELLAAARRVPTEFPYPI